MRRVAILTVAGVVVLAVGVQLVLPALAERHVEGMLTEHGGSASVELHAFPAPRLLFKEGHSLKVRASGLVLPPVDPGSKSTLGDLDGFDEVDVQVVGMRTGPLEIARLTLARDGDGPYRFAMQATATGSDVASYAGAQLGGSLGGFLGGLAGGAMPGANVPIPLDLNAVLRSDDGRVRAVTVDGSVLGLPAGPFVEALAAAVAGRF